jgi:predicted lipid-binding transport protein (Tim44 family)
MRNLFFKKKQKISSVSRRQKQKFKCRTNEVRCSAGPETGGRRKSTGASLLCFVGGLAAGVMGGIIVAACAAVTAAAAAIEAVFSVLLLAAAVGGGGRGGRLVGGWTAILFVSTESVVDVAAAIPSSPSESDSTSPSQRASYLAPYKAHECECANSWGGG